MHLDCQESSFFSIQEAGIWECSSNTNYKFHLLSKFNIPTAPIILHRLVTEIIQLQQENQELNIIDITESNMHGGSHKNKQSFQKYCHDQLRKLPQKLVKNAEKKDEEEIEQNKKCIKTLLVDGVIIEVAKTYGMVEQKK